MLGFPKPSQTIQILSLLPRAECAESLQEQISSSYTLPEWPLVGKVKNYALRIGKPQPVRLFGYDPCWMEFYAKLFDSGAGTKIIGQFRVNHSVKFALIISALLPIIFCVLTSAPIATALAGIAWLVGTFLFFSYRKHRAYQSLDDQSYVIDYIRKVVEAEPTGAMDRKPSLR